MCSLVGPKVSAVRPNSDTRLRYRHVDLLVLDALRKDEDSATHIGLPSALTIAKDIRATKTLLVGMIHTVSRVIFFCGFLIFVMLANQYCLHHVSQVLGKGVKYTEKARDSFSFA